MEQENLPRCPTSPRTKQVSFHTFRHTFGTLLNANGENSKVVQELLRHASLKVTTDVYMQAVGPQKRHGPFEVQFQPPRCWFSSFFFGG